MMVMLFQDAHDHYTVKVRGTDVGSFYRNWDTHDWVIRIHGEKATTTYTDKQAALDYLELRFDEPSLR